MSRLIHRKIKVTPLVHPTAARTTSTDLQNAAIDTLGFEEALILIHTGVVDDVTLNIDIQHSNEATANFATVPAPVNTKINPRLLQMVNADDNTIVVGYLDLSGLKRYIKPVDTLNANSAFYVMSVMLFGPDDSVKTNDTNQVYEADATA